LKEIKCDWCMKIMTEYDQHSVSVYIAHVVAGRDFRACWAICASCLRLFLAKPVDTTDPAE
jgi:hypothetical protein